MNDGIYKSIIVQRKLTFGEKLKQLRLICCFTQDGFAEAMHLSSRTPISQMENLETVCDMKEEWLYRVSFFLDDWTYRLPEDDLYRKMADEIREEIRKEVHRIMSQEETAKTLEVPLEQSLEIKMDRNQKSDSEQRLKRCHELCKKRDSEQRLRKGLEQRQKKKSALV